MDFEKAYEKYKDGVANEEEIVFVEQELEKARKMTEIIDAYEYKKAISDDVDEAKIKKAQKKYAKKNSLKILTVSIIVLALAAAVVLSAVFGTAFGSANKNRNYSQTEAEQIALTYVVKNFGESTKPVLAKSDEEIDYSSDLKHSVYVYEVKIYIGYVNEVEVKVNAKTGKVVDVNISSI